MAVGFKNALRHSLDALQVVNDMPSLSPQSNSGQLFYDELVSGDG
jgi:hypothetical protein